MSYLEGENTREVLLLTDLKSLVLTVAWTGRDARRLGLTFDRLHVETNPLFIIIPELLCKERQQTLCLPCDSDQIVVAAATVQGCLPQW